MHAHRPLRPTARRRPVLVGLLAVLGAGALTGCGLGTGQTLPTASVTALQTGWTQIVTGLINGAATVANPTTNRSGNST